MYLDRTEELDKQYSDIAVLFECKNSCQTILQHQYVQEMNRFTAEAVNHELWEKLCYRGLNNFYPLEWVVDGAQCTQTAYQNLTSKLEESYKQARSYYELMTEIGGIDKWFNFPDPREHKDEFFQKLVNASANDV